VVAAREFGAEVLNAAKEPVIVEVTEGRSSPLGNIIRMPSSSLTISFM
jgi:hypothetical protein